MNDPFDALRLHDEPVTPDRRFTARLRARIADALSGTDVPIVQLPERSPTMSTTSTSSSTATEPDSTAPAAIVPYLCVNRGLDAMQWYVDVFGGREVVRYTGDDGRLGHGEVDIDGARIYLSDEYPEIGVMSPTTIGSTSVALNLAVADVDAVHARAVDAGATSLREPADQSYGERSATVLDPFGHRWMIQTTIATPSIEEIDAASEGFTVTAPDETALGVGRPPVELGYFTITTPETERALRFYGELFGWVAEPGNAGAGYAHVANTKLPLGFVPGDADDPPTLYFRVDDVDAAARRVVELGGTIVSEQVFDSGRNADCRDDQGRPLQLWEPAPGY